MLTVSMIARGSRYITLRYLVAIPLGPTALADDWARAGGGELIDGLETPVTETTRR